MTVLENVMFPLDMFSNDTYKDRLKRAQFCLDRVNLSEAGHSILLDQRRYDETCRYCPRHRPEP